MAYSRRFRVALSFPGEHRKRVENIALALATELGGRDNILYDQWHDAEFAKPDFDLDLEKVYRDESQLVVFFFCEAYSKKPWCGVEWRIGRELRFRGEANRVMCLRLDHAEVPGLSPLDGYIDIANMPNGHVADRILKRLDLLTPSINGAKQHRVFIAKLPTVNSLLIGRGEQIEFLDRAWADSETNFIQIIAPGGTGKTALMDKWFRRHLDEATVFGWSFYSQGTSEQRQGASSDPFFAEIMSWLNISLPSTASVYAKAEAVANRLREEKMLLILDGIEPMQDSTGFLRDSALKALLQELSTKNAGLVLCTTRVRLDLPDDPPRVLSVDLDNLTPGNGAEYLGHLGVHGEQQELEQASKDCGNHALALTLLGTYLVDFLHGDIRRRVEIRELMVDEAKYGAHARRMMAAYERMFQGKPEAALLRALGYFDRPAEPAALKLVLPTMKERPYQAALNRLHQARLVLSKELSESVDCHPLIREHFAAVMRATAAEEFREGHSKLYEHYCEQAPDQPDTLDEMTPLFYAVYHGCLAGRHQEAFDTVYRERIRQGETFFLTRMLGAFGTNLSLLANFFETPWSQPVTGLSEAYQSWVVGNAGYTLRALGRLADAIGPMRSAAEARLAMKDWKNASTNYSNLSQSLLVLGQVHPAIRTARQAVEFADRSEDQFQRLFRRAALADALFQSGDLVEATDLFTEAEKMQKELQPEYPVLYALQGFLFCALLLDQGKLAEVIRRATQTLRWVEKQHWLLDIGLNHLSLGCAYPRRSPESVRHLNQAVDFLRQSGELDDLPRGLLARGTPADLDEVFRIASRCGMKLHLTDYHLASARLALKNHELAKAREHTDKAAALIDETGYHRRDKALAELRAEIENLGN
jgi:tetratricopeptide (TPR) repeat protein